MFFYGPLHMDMAVLANHQELTSGLCGHCGGHAGNYGW